MILIVNILCLFLQKPYACQIPGCLKRYTDPSSLRKHIKNHSLRDSGQKRRKTHREVKARNKNLEVLKQDEKCELHCLNSQFTPIKPSVEKTFTDFDNIINETFTNLKKDFYVPNHISSTDDNFLNFDEVSDCLVNLN